jgi:hypothetical protein
MKPAIEKRLASLEKSLEAETRWELICPDDESETIDSQIARWLSGKNLPGFPNHIAADRADVNLIIIHAVAPRPMGAAAV